jgi:MFS family permease
MTPAQDPGAARRPPLWAPLAHRSFALLWGGIVVSFFGDVIQVYAQHWLIVTQFTVSGLQIALVTLAQSLPRLLLAVVSGALIDRFDRRRLLIVTHALALLQTIAFLVLLLADEMSFGWILLLAGGLGIVDTINITARTAIAPLLVPPAMLGPALALQALGINMVQILAPAVTAFLIGTFGIAGCIAANLASYVVLIAALVAVPLPSVRKARAQASFGGDIREGLRYVRSRRPLWASIALGYVLGFFGMPIVRFLALYALVVLEADASQYGALGAAMGVGAIAASLFVTARARSTRLGAGFVATAACFVAAIGMLTVVRSLGGALAALALLGFGQMASRTATTRIIQLQVPKHLQGRLLSLQLADAALVSLGALSLGAVVDWIAAGSGRAGHAAIQSGLLSSINIMACACGLALLVFAPMIVRGDAETRVEAVEQGGS